MFHRWLFINLNHCQLTVNFYCFNPYHFVSFWFPFAFTVFIFYNSLAFIISSPIGIICLLLSVQFLWQIWFLFISQALCNLVILYNSWFSSNLLFNIEIPCDCQLQVNHQQVNLSIDFVTSFFDTFMFTWTSIRMN